MPISGRSLEPERPIPTRTPARSDPSRGRVGLLLGCVQRVFFADVQRAAIEVLAAEGYEVIAPGLPDCCGAIERDAGEQRAALARAQRTIQAFSSLGGIDHIVTTSGGCGAELKRYGERLGTPQARAFSAIVRDLNELLAERPPRAPRGPVPIRVAYHDSCQLEHCQRIREQPRALLGQIPELDLLEPVGDSYICCGAAGLNPIRQPELAAELGDRAAAALLTTRPDAIATASYECAAHLGRHVHRNGGASSGGPVEIPVQHPVEFLWRSLQAAGQIATGR